jgi:hypothetical protein
VKQGRRVEKGSSPRLGTLEITPGAFRMNTGPAQCLVSAFSVPELRVFALLQKEELYQDVDENGQSLVTTIITS